MKPTEKRALAAAFRAVFIERMDDLGLTVDAMADACGLQLTKRTLYARVRHDRDALLFGRVV